MLFEGLLILKCDLRDPENILGYDRVATQPIGVEIKQIDFFTLKILWQVDSPKDVISYSVYRNISEIENANNEQYILIDELSIDSVVYDSLSEKLVFYDTTADYGKWNKYYFVSNYKTMSSHRSEVVSHHFQINPPLVSLDPIEQSYVLQSYSLSDLPLDQIDGIEIVRESPNGTIVNKVIYSILGDTSLMTMDSLIFSTNVDSAYIGRPIYKYENIEPNIPYKYKARAIQNKDDELRHSDFSSNKEISIPRVALANLSMKPISDNRFRYYFDSVDVNFDSVLLFSQDSETHDDWIYIDSRAVADIPYYDYLGRFLYDVDFEQNLPGMMKIVLEGKNSHSLFSSEANIFQKDTVYNEQLSILGFTLIEGGSFIAGCLQQDANCEDNEFPVSGSESLQEMEAFYLSIYEVSEDVYNDPSTWPVQEGQIPVDNVSWDDALTYCNILSDIYSEYIFSLPDEFEWEYAAKWNYLLNSGSIYPWGNEIDIYSANYANYLGALRGVGEYPSASFQGTFDMAGNALEWVSSCYTDSLFQMPADTSCWRVARGGGYWQNPFDLRTTSRQNYPRNLRVPGLGFRVKMVRKSEVNI
jgi:hypothetical protein